MEIPLHFLLPLIPHHAINAILLPYPFALLFSSSSFTSLLIPSFSSFNVSTPLHHLPLPLFPSVSPLISLLLCHHQSFPPLNSLSLSLVTIKLPLLPPNFSFSSLFLFTVLLPPWTFHRAPTEKQHHYCTSL